ncbi:MAG: glycosyltransferase [bacterium]
MKFSIVIPARNEAAHIGRCLESIAAASVRYAGQVEVIVVINRCTDDTEAIALRHGTVIACDDSRNLSRIRNAGARVATGDILMTIDADSWMSANMIETIDRKLSTGRFIGGGVPIYTERVSVGIFLTAMLILSMLPGLSAGLFWCYRKDFNAIGGFDETVVVGEDVDFAKRLRAYGQKMHKRFGTAWGAKITTSCRKFDRFGDWFVLRHPLMLWRAVRGQDSGFGDRLFYDFER